MHEGPPDTSTFEESPEKVPTPEDVEVAFEQLIGGERYEEIRKLEDEEGLYLWDVVSGGNEYSYMRKGQYAEGQASESAIHVTFFDDSGVPCGGHSVAKFVNGSFILTP